MKPRYLSLLALAALPIFAGFPVVGPASLSGQDQSVEVSRGGPTDPAEFEAFMDGLMHVVLDQFNTAGAVVSVVSGGEVFYAKGYGYSDWDARTPVDPETTLFRIGSVSKLFVWTSVMQMVEQGLLDLDTDINEYLDFEIPAAFDDPVTLGNIMGHAGGFEDYVLELFGTEPEDVRPLGELLSEQTPARVRPPGDLSSYSNHATGMAAYMVERASGVEWKEYMEENILAPLGMEFTTFRQPLPDDLAPHMSKGYRFSGARFAEQDFEYVPLAPVGAAAASALDMSRFMIAHLQLGQYGDQRILSEETARLMQSDHHRMDPAVNAMAHGFMGYSQNGERIIGHGGDTRIFHTGLWLFPEHDLGVFVSFNSQGGGGARGPVMAAFLDRYFPAEEAEATLPEDLEAFSERVKRFTGEYVANRHSHTTITKVQAALTTSVSKTDRGTLRALGAHWIEVGPLTFREEFGPRTMVFREDADGKITNFLVSSSPIGAWERAPLGEHPALHVPILILAIATVTLTLFSPLVGGGIRRWFGVQAGDLLQIPKAARATLWFAAFFFAMGMILIGANVMNDSVAVEMPKGMGFFFLMPVLAAVPTLGSVFYAIRLWVKGEGRPTVRVLYSVAAISFCVFLWQLNVWNLLGWNY